MTPNTAPPSGSSNPQGDEERLADPSDPQATNGLQTGAESLRDQIAAAIYERNNPGRHWADAHPDDVLAYRGDADAALRVRDREMEQLRADCQKWADCAASAERVRRSHAADADRYEAGLRQQLAEAEERARHAEAALGSVRTLHQPARDWSWATFGCEHQGQHAKLCARCRTCYPCPTLAALDAPEPPAEPPVHIGGRANAEDCPACAGTDLPYPWICPGPQPPSA